MTFINIRQQLITPVTTLIDMGGFELPIGWVCEQASHDPELFYLGNGHGWVTVNLKTRSYALGTVTPRKNQDIYKGKAWKKAIFSHAASALKLATETA